MAVLRFVAVVAIAGCTNSVDIPCSSSGQCPAGEFCNPDGVCEEGGQGVLQTVVGGNVGDGRPSQEAILRDISALAVDTDGTIYLAEFQHGRIRKITPDGIITTFVGTGVQSSGGGLPGDGRTVRTTPIGLALDDTYLYYSDVFTGDLRRVDKATGTVEFMVGAGSPRGIAVDPDSDFLYVASPDSNRVFRVDKITFALVGFAGTGTAGVSGDGGNRTAAELTDPYGVVVRQGILYISDGNRIRSVDLSSNIIDTFAGGRGGAVGDGGAPIDAGFTDMRHLALDADGNMLIADNGNSRVRIVDFDANTVDTLAGGQDCCFIASGVAPTSTFLPQPEAVAGAPDGSVLVGDNRNNLLRRISGGTIETIAGGESPVGDSGTDARINRPFGVEADRDGGFFVVDPEASSVFQVSAGGTVSIVAGSGVRGFSGDGEQATEALLDFPEDVALDAGGNIYISDTGNARIRRVDIETGIISTFAGGGVGGDGGPANQAELLEPAAIEFHPNPDDGRLFIAERSGHRIRVVDTAGNISTIAGSGVEGNAGNLGDPLMAEMSQPNGLAFDKRGYLYISERGSHVIRRFRESTDGEFRNLIGQAFIGGFCGDKSYSQAACLNSPHHLAVDLSNDTLYIADQGNHRIRKYVILDGELDSATGGGFGEGGLIESTTSAELATPFGLAAVPGGGILVGNSGTGEVKLLVE